MANFLIGVPNEHEEKMSNYLEGLKNFISCVFYQNKWNIPVRNIQKAAEVRKEIFEGIDPYFEFLGRCAKRFGDLESYKQINIRGLEVHKFKIKNEEIAVKNESLIQRSIYGLETLADDGGIVVLGIPNETTYSVRQKMF